MAVIFPSGIYTEGQGIFDAMPYVRLIEARKKAKDEAFRKYFNDLNTKVNTAGVRQQDIVDPVTGKGIDNDVMQWKTYGMQNMNDIVKGGSSKYVFEEMFRKIQNRIQQSKDVKDFSKDVDQKVFEGKIDPDDDDMKALDKIKYSIYDPRHYRESMYDVNYKEDRGTPIGWADLSQAVPTMTTDEQKKFHEFSLGGEKKEREAGTEKSFRGYTEYFEKYPKDALVRGAERAAYQVKDNPVSVEERKIRKTFNRIKEDPTWLAKADPVFQDYFGRPIANAKDAAAADFILNYKDLRERKTQPIKTPRAGGGGGKGEDGKFYDAWSLVVDKFNEDAGKGASYTQINTLPNSIVKDAVIAQANAGQQKVSGLNPYDETNIFIASDGAGGLDIYSTVNNPKLERNSRTFVAHLTQEATNNIANKSLGTKAKQAALPTVSQPAGKTAKAVKYPLPKGKPRTVKQGNFTYTWNENTGTYE